MTYSFESSTIHLHPRKKQGAERKAFVSYPGRQRRIDYRFSFTKPGHASLLVRLVPSNGHPARRSRGTLRLRASRNPRKYSNTHSNRAKFLFSRIRDNESSSSSSLPASLTLPPPPRIKSDRAIEKLRSSNVIGENCRFRLLLVVERRQIFRFD